MKNNTLLFSFFFFPLFSRRHGGVPVHRLQLSAAERQQAHHRQGKL